MIYEDLSSRHWACPETEMRLRGSPMLFNSYDPGKAFGAHTDNAIRATPRATLCTDLPATLTLGNRFEGGELVIDDLFSERTIRLQPVRLVLYPPSSLHRLAPIISGERLVAAV